MAKGKKIRQSFAFEMLLFNGELLGTMIDISKSAKHGQMSTALNRQRQVHQTHRVYLEHSTDISFSHI
jgi:hypothetical protein